MRHKWIDALFEGRERAHLGGRNLMSEKSRSLSEKFLDEELLLHYTNIELYYYHNMSI